MGVTRKGTRTAQDSLIFTTRPIFTLGAVHASPLGVADLLLIFFKNLGILLKFCTVSFLAFPDYCTEFVEKLDVLVLKRGKNGWSHISGSKCKYGNVQNLMYKVVKYLFSTLLCFEYSRFLQSTTELVSGNAIHEMT